MMEYKGFSLQSDLKGKVVVLTGASGGIGRTIADLLAKNGASMLLVDAIDQVKDLASSLDKIYSGDIRAVTAEFTAPSMADEIADACQNEFGKVDVLINCAGTGHEHTLLNLTSEGWDHIMTVNLKAPFLISQAIVNRFMKPAGIGTIINMASQAGIVALDNQAAYCISKAGLLSLTRSMAYEWGHFGITATALAPTIIRTKSAMDFWEAEGRDKVMLEQIPVHRFGETEEVAAACLYLASGAGGLLSGSAMVMDGGYTIR